MIMTCLPHPNEDILVLRPWRVDFCRGDVCGALLLNVFESGHTLRLRAWEQIGRHSNEPIPVGKLQQRYTELELEMHLFLLFSASTIRYAMEKLNVQRAISLHSDPDPNFVAIPWILEFHPGVLEAFLAQYKPYLKERAPQTAEGSPAGAATVLVAEGAGGKKISNKKFAAGQNRVAVT